MSPNWSHGYVTDESYAETFFRELSPAWLNYVAALNGAPPRDLDQPFAYLELGCGFGHSAVVNAAAFPRGTFHANDFNPAHIEGGRRHSSALGVGNIQFHDEPFQRLIAAELPPFDFIVLHGVYSWVTADDRQAIRRIIYETLKPGGLVYVSYNALPGWSIELPLRKLLVELAASGDGGSPRRTQRALQALSELSSNRLRYFNAHPAAGAAVESYLKGPSNYIAHEFLNEAWEPFYSVDLADEMAEIDLRYVGSATLVDNHPTLIVEGRAAEAVARLDTARQRQLAIDFAANQRFRRDVFIRSQPRLDPPDITNNLYSRAIGCIGNPARIGPTAKVPRGEIRFQDRFVHDLQALLRRGSLTIGEAVAALGGERRETHEIVRNLIFLVAAGALMPFAKARRHDRATVTGRASPLLQRALAHILERGVRRSIPSEVLGNGIEMLPIEAVAVAGWLAGCHELDALTDRTTIETDRMNFMLTKDGERLESRDARRAHILATTRRVLEDVVPSLIRLGLVE